MATRPTGKIRIIQATPRESGSQFSGNLPWYAHLAGSDTLHKVYTDKNTEFQLVDPTLAGVKGYAAVSKRDAELVKE